MITAYKGRFKMECLLERCSKSDILTNIQPDCIVCENVNAQVIDLDDKPVFTISFNKAPEPTDREGPESDFDFELKRKREFAAEKGKKKR